ncbi:MAG: polyphenol oxidase family protein [Acidimicrobiales bacterium]
MTVFELAGGGHCLFTGRGEGDMGHGGRHVSEVAVAVESRRRAVVDLPWTWLRQVHSGVVRIVTEPGGCAGTTGDALVTDQAVCALAVLTADCAPVVLSSDEGVVGVAHAGWVGLTAGILEATVDAMRSLGGSKIDAVIGPCIRPACYEFGTDDLDRVATGLGPEVKGCTAGGGPALDLAAGVRICLARAGVDQVADTGTCTACATGQYFSWRARHERERQATVVWR